MNLVSGTLAKKCLPSIVVIVLLVLGLTNSVDTPAHKQLSGSFNNALATFALVRGINAVISVVQGTELALEPGGLGVVLTPGEVLDPVNDLIERFSWVVLAAATSLGAQLILLEIGTSFAILVLLVAASGILVLLIWAPALVADSWRKMLVRFALVVLLLRFLVPAVVLVNELVYQSFLNESYTHSYEVLENVNHDMQALRERDESQVAEAETNAAADGSIFGSVSRFYNLTKQKLNLSANYKKYEAKVSGAAQQIINLIAIFIFQTLVFPLVFLWFALRLGRMVVSSAFWFDSSDRQ